jgi:hypothetical protein
MQAFQGYIENGRIIPVDMPQAQDGLRVIITVLDSTQTFINLRSRAGALTSSDFTALKLDTRNFKFDREEAHERAL